jgi:2-keto-3-deoxy-galactonokinase
MAYEEERIRDAFRESARRARPHGARQEELFPVRAAGLAGINPREGDILDQTGKYLVGIDTIIGTFTT